MSEGDKIWKFFYPDDGEDEFDARELNDKDVLFNDAYWAAKAACEWDYNNRDGWEYVGKPFPITIIAPSGNHIPFICEHEPEINHAVREA